MKNILILLLLLSNFAFGETIFEKFRVYYPEYSDVPDKKLKIAIYRKYYSGMRYEDFLKALNQQASKDHKFNFPSDPLQSNSNSKNVYVNPMFTCTSIIKDTMVCM